MGTRTVSVDLQLKAAGFVAGAKEAEQATGKLNAELADVGEHDREFADAVKDTETLTAAVKETGRTVDDTGDQMRQAGADAKFLAGELDRARTAALEAAAAFTLTGDRADLLTYKKSARYASDLEKLARELDSGSGEAAQAATQVGASLGTRIGQNAGENVAQALAGRAAGLVSDPLFWAVAGPALVEAGAGLGGALLTGIGLAGIGAGIAGQLADPDIDAAGLELGRHVAAGFTTASAAFKAPILDVIAAARDEWDHLAIGLKTTFDYLAPEVRTLGGGLIGFVDQLVPGIERAAVAAEPLVDDFANWLPQAGREFSGLLETMADNADTLDDGLKLVLGTISAIVNVVNYGVTAGSWLFKAAEWTTGTIDAVESLGDSSDKASGYVKKLDDQVKPFTLDLAALSTQLNATTVSTDTLAGGIADKLFTTMMAGDQATLGFAEAQTRLAASLKENKRQLDIHTAAGQANREAILGAVQANIQVYDAMIKAGFSAKDAADAYDANTAALEKQLRQAHFTDDQINQLIGRYKAVPDTVNTDIEANGLVSALNNLGALIAAANGIDGRKFGFTVTEKIEVQGHYYTYTPGQDFGHGLAKGGHWAGRAAAVGTFLPPMDPGWILAGEQQTGGEWLIPQQGISQARAYDLLASAAAPHGMSVGVPAALAGGRAAAGVTTIRLSFEGAEQPLVGALVGSLRAVVQDGGGNVQVVIGQGA